ncbi:tail protein X [Halocynthiibacter namhaensis]|uniref:tail protein X n=1 Tax=Halocynthiibacter namhaensis TaxID=1290553 RepID=UPI000578FE2B|nr:tail protein X [Halocynthiibacter namhaensis]
MTPYRTKDGDMIDAICKAHYGSETMAEAVYEANPGLAAMGSLLPMGVVVLLPERTPEPVRQPIRLWG